MRIIFVLFGLYQLAAASFSVFGTISVASGASFVQFVRNHDETVAIHNCTLEYGYETFPILMDKTQDFASNTVFGKRLRNLARNICGIQVVDHRNDDPENMTLYAHYTDYENKEQIYSGPFTVQTEHAHKPFHHVVKVDLGLSVTVNCTNYSDSCTLLDPDGNIADESRSHFAQCKSTILHVKVSHLGNWTCIEGFPGSPDFVESHIELGLAKTPVVSTWYKEEGGFGMIGCSYESDFEMETVQFCQFIDPRSDVYTVSYGCGATERYTSVGTDLDKFICQIEFKLPLLPHEIGQWKCLIETRTGGFVSVPSSAGSLRSLGSDYAKRKIVNIKLGNALDIFCQVPYSSNNCYIKTPADGYILGGDVDDFRLGECKTSVAKSSVEDLGIWTCHYSKPDSAVDDTIEIQVREHNTVHSLYKDVEVDLSQSAELFCEATVPIQTCQYIGPSGLSYNVFPGKGADGIEYVGRGLEYGDCGLKIERVRPEHAGDWTCLVNNVQIPDKYLQDVTRVYVNRFSVLPATATSIGVAVGVMAVAVAVLGGAIYTRYKKRSPDGRLSVGSSNGSNSNVPIVNAQIQTVYSTSDPQ